MVFLPAFCCFQRAFAQTYSIHSDEKSRIEADYARQDIARANENRNKLLVKYDLLDQQLAKELIK